MLNLNFVYVKKTSSKIDDIYKDGIHIMILEICTNTAMRHAIRNRVIDLCKETMYLLII